MRPSLRNLQIEELIVHDIPKKLSKKVLREAPDYPTDYPIFSEIASPVSTDVVTFFHDKIAGSIGSTDAVNVIFDLESSSPIRPLVQKYFESNENRISITQNMAQYLFDIQNAINSGGLLLFVRCNNQGNTALAVLKVEREEGVRVKQLVNNGLVTFDVEHIHDLMLTKKTKLFKVVLFYIEDTIIKGIVCDQQRGYSNKDVADFFIYDYLGCKLTEEPKVLTKKFFEVTQKYINEKINSPVEKGIMMSHLLSVLTDQNLIINPSEFSRRALPVEQRDNYVRYIKENDIIANNFSKDTSMIKDKIEKVQYDFCSGITVFGSNEAISSKSRMIDMENGVSKMEIIDCLKKVKAK